MQFSNVQEWIDKQESRKKILIATTGPLTAAQLGVRTGLPAQTCSYVISKLASKALVICLNPKARSSRLYGLTELGKRCQKQLCEKDNLPVKEYNTCVVDWDIYGQVCFNHRSAVIKVLKSPLKPSQIKRVLKSHKPNIKISANNIRDIIKFLLEIKIVRKVFIDKSKHPYYELSEIGNQFRQLLIQA